MCACKSALFACAEMPEACRANRTQSRLCGERWVCLEAHETHWYPQPLAKKICFAKIFCEEEERAFSARCSALPNSRILRSVPTMSVRKEFREQSYHDSRKQGCPAQRAPNCRYFGLWRKGELARAKIVSLENRAKRENEPQSAAGLSRRCFLSNHGILSRLCVRKFVKKEE